VSTPVLKIKVLPKPVIKGKMDVRFPAKVETEEFLTVTRDNGTYKFGVDFSVLTPGPVSDPETAFVAIEDQTAGIYRTVSLASLLTSGLDADLQAIAALTSTGILTRTADDTWELRAIAGTANEITVTNGDGVSGNPTISLPDALTFTDKTVTGGTFESPVIHTPTGIVKGDVGLSDVDNTSDADKPVSTATQTALDLKANTTDLAAVAISGSYTDLSNKPYTVPAGGTTGQALVKASGTDGDTEWGDATGSGGASTVATITALKGLDTSSIKTTVLTADGRAGIFNFLAGDYSTHVSTDTNEGIYIKADDTAATSGAWVRQFDFVNYNSKWFGATADYSTDNTAIIDTIISVADLTNTLTTAGKQGAAYINIEQGVKFASSSLNFLSSAQHVFVYLRYFANSDTSQGVVVLGNTQGTNELMELSVNSGYPGDSSGGLVAERRFNAPLHPASVLNVAKQVSGADNHLGTSQARAPTSTSPARASYNILDENLLRWRAVYEGYGNNNVATQLSLQPFTTAVDLANVGTNGWPTSPSAGTVVTGVTSGAKGYKAATQANPTVTLNLVWISGTFVPGEKVTDGVTTSTNSITGGGVSYHNNSFPSLAFGINTPVVSYGEFAGYPVTGYAIHARLTIGKTNSSAATTLKETVTNAAVLFTNTSGAAPSTGRQVILDNSNRLVSVSGVSNTTGSTATQLVAGVSGFCKFGNSGGVSSNSFNIASVTRTGIGVYAVAFTNALANANYVVSCSRQGKADFPTFDSLTTSGFSLFNFDSSGAAADLTFNVYVAVIGGV
jgi:hypothetical protein